MKFYQMEGRDVLAHFSSRPTGLTHTQVTKHRAKYGRNVLVVKGEPLWRKLIEPFFNVFTLVLVVAIAISLWHEAYLDAIVVGAIIVISAVIYYIQRFSTDRILATLRQQNSHVVQVYRDGKVVALDAGELVPGDVIVLAEGEKVPADARVLSAQNARVDESQLTGESLPIAKTPDILKSDRQLYEQKNMVFQGSFVVAGELHAVVTTTGNHTEFGTIAVLSEGGVEQSPVQKKIDSLITKIIASVGGISLVVLVLALMRGMELSEALRFVIALAVSAVPEGLPVAISIILALGMQRMARKKALVRSMSAIETIGTITTIATDKTGTLTKNKLSVVDTWQLTAGKQTVEHLAAMCQAMGDKAMHDPLDSALVYFAKSIPKSQPLVVLPFDQTLAMSGSLWHKGAAFSAHIKGSPESIIKHSDLSAADKKIVMQATSDFAKKGYRVIALSHATVKQKITSLEQLTASTKLEFDALIAIADTLRPEASSAIRRAQAAGISVRMITGDHRDTAYTIGENLGMVSRPDQVIDAAEFTKLSDAEAADKLQSVRVFSRILPAQKFRILQLLKKHDITAMTGDGVNDVPALTKAHVGIAMGDGSSIARDAGDIILLDNNFRTIIDAVAEGRRIFANIRAMLLYLLATSIGEVIAIVGALVAGLASPFTPLQILFINLATDTSLVIPLGLEPGDKSDMSRPPARPNAPLFNKVLIARMLFDACALAITALTVFYLFMPQGETYARTMAFCSIVIAQWSSALAMRDFGKFSWQIITHKNNAFWAGVALSIILLGVVLYTPVSTAFNVVHPQPQHLAVVALAASLAPIIASDFHKLFTRKKVND